jgi:hypothetical protein
VSAVPEAEPRTTAGALRTAHASRRPVLFDAGAAFLASVAGKSFAPGGVADVAWAPRGPRWAARLAVMATSTRDLPLGNGHAEWLRAGIGLGPRCRFSVARRWLFDLHVEGIAALVSVGGVGYAQNQHAFDFNPGIGFGGAVSARFGRVAPFIGIGAVGWPRRQDILTTEALRASLPQFEVLFSSGLAFGRFQ